MQLPEFPTFRKLLLEDKPLLNSLFKEMQPQISELTFTNLFVWNDSEPVILSSLGHTLLLQRRRLRDNHTFLLPPLGREPLANVLKTLKEARFNNIQVPPLYGLKSNTIITDIADEKIREKYHSVARQLLK